MVCSPQVDTGQGNTCDSSCFSQKGIPPDNVTVDPVVAGSSPVVLADDLGCQAVPRGAQPLAKLGVVSFLERVSFR
jgi:hypothetical protein